MVGLRVGPCRIFVGSKTLSRIFVNPQSDLCRYRKYVFQVQERYGLHKILYFHSASTKDEK